MASAPHTVFATGRRKHRDGTNKMSKSAESNRGAIYLMLHRLFRVGRTFLLRSDLTGMLERFANEELAKA